MSDNPKFKFIADDKFIVVEDGRIFKLLEPPVSSNGYKFVRIGTKSYPVHRVIAGAFVPNPENKPEVNHIDGDKTNNAVSNLEWVTRKENARHAAAHGLLGRGGRHRDRSDAQRQRRLNEAALITEKDVAQSANCKIRIFRKKSGMSQRDLAYAIGVSQSAVAQWETGIAQPTIDNLRKVADILGISPGELL